MAIITLNFDNPINVSLQKKTNGLTGHDIVYYVNDDPLIGVVRLGECTGINRTLNTIDVEVGTGVIRPTGTEYVFFGKDTEVGTSGVIGYYAEVEMKNDSRSAAELHAVSTEFFISSK